MTQKLTIHPENPQLRLVHRVVETLQNDGVIVFPTDSCYALGCAIGNKEAAERIRRIRQLDEKHHFTLICKDFSELATYAYVDNSAFRILKAFTPGPYTFLLLGSKEVPRRLLHPKRKTIGLRIPDNVIAQTILSEYGQPIMSVTMMFPGEAEPPTDAETIYSRLQGRVDLIVDGGACDSEPTTVVDLIDDVPKIVRVGKGDPTPFQ